MFSPTRISRQAPHQYPRPRPARMGPLSSAHRQYVLRSTVFCLPSHPAADPFRLCLGDEYRPLHGALRAGFRP